MSDYWGPDFDHTFVVELLAVLRQIRDELQRLCDAIEERNQP